MHSYRKPKLPIDMEYAMSSTGNGDGARNDESDGDVHSGDGNCEIQKSKNTSMEGPSSTYEGNPNEIVHHATKMLHIKKMITETSMSNIEKAQQKDKFYYDRKHSNEQVRVISMLSVLCTMFALQEFHPGDLLLLQNSHRDSKMGDELQPTCLGPYRVYETLEKGVCRLWKGSEICSEQMPFEKIQGSNTFINN